MIKWIVLGVIVVLILVLIFTNVVIVPQASEYVLEVLGKYRATWTAGIHVKTPFISRIVNKVTTKEQVLDTPPQPVITKDNVTMQIDAVVYFHIFDAKMYTYGAVNPVVALANLSATTLRNIIGSMSLDEALTSRDTINAQLTALLDTATDPWGIKVTRVELKNIMPPDEIRQAMEKELKAERNKRQTLLEAEAHKQAVITRAEGDKEAMILAAKGEAEAEITRAEGEAKALLLAKEAEAKGLKMMTTVVPVEAVLEIKKYDSMVNVANGTAAKIIVPTDVVEPVKRNVLFSETTELGDHTKAASKVVDEKPDECCDDKGVPKPSTSSFSDNRFK